MYGAVKPLLFQLDPERAHHLALAFLRRAQLNSPLRRAITAWPPSSRLRTTLLGHDLPGPLGMAAGFDKGCETYNALLALGFSHVELGTITPKPQPGNEKPRIQRLPEQEALVNRMGFPGPGTALCVESLHRRPPLGLVGANIGPNKTTPSDRVAEDLVECARVLAPLTGYLAINVSSPNTPGLRALQTPDWVGKLVRATVAAADASGSPRPVLLKLHPDAPDDELKAVAKAAVAVGAAGIIATNTTRARPAGTEDAMEGGLSGKPLRERATAAIGALHHGLGRDVPIIGVGGILTGADALAHLAAGATCVQAYTGFVYRGPRFAPHIHRELLAGLDKLGVDRVEQLRDVTIGKLATALA